MFEKGMFQLPLLPKKIPPDVVTLNNSHFICSRLWGQALRHWAGFPGWVFYSTWHSL